jgi:hypothetical protein
VSLTEQTNYPAFWGHDSKKVKSIRQHPNSYLHLWGESPRGPDYGVHLWERAGNILLAEGLRFNTHSVIGVGFDTEVLGNTWWAFKSVDLSKDQIKALLLWINSSLSLLLLFGRRVVTEGPWIHLKQPTWENMPVLDIRKLSEYQITSLAKKYDVIADKTLEKFSNLCKDRMRGFIDETLASILSFPSISSIRELLGREPGLSAGGNKC